MSDNLAIDLPTVPDNRDRLRIALSRIANGIRNSDRIAIDGISPDKEIHFVKPQCRIDMESTRLEMNSSHKVNVKKKRIDKKKIQKL